jgi:CheY-like chemotaxis protein
VPKSVRVLVVDDNRDAAESLARMLELMGHSATFVTDPAAAMPMLRAERADIVFLDLGMPQIDGFQLARRIRAECGLDNPCLVALTGYGTASDRAKTRHSGFDAHLLKPASPDLVRSTIEELCKPRLR